MKILRADLIENYANADEADAGYILVDELTKALMLFPKAANDIFGTEGKEPMDLAQLACNGLNDKQAKRLVKLMLLVNQRSEGDDFIDVSNLENASMRSLFSKNGDYFDREAENIEAIAADLKSVVTDENALPTVHEFVTDYANFGGDGDKPKAKWPLYVAIALAVGGGIFYYIKTRKSAE